MPWDVTIHRADGAVLGELQTVREQIATALRAIQFYREPSGLEKIAAARAVGVEFPDVLLRHFEQQPAADQAEFEGPGFSILLYGFGHQPLTRIHAEIRGDGNPVQALAAICLSSDWVAVDDTSGEPLDLASGSASEWEAFREYLDRAVRSIQTAKPEQ